MPPNPVLDNEAAGNLMTEKQWLIVKDDCLSRVFTDVTAM